VYERAISRENRLWTPYAYSFPFETAQVTERVIVYGLYSGAYLNLHDYLSEIEAVELANLLNDYNAKIAELTTQEQIVVADIVSKRYLVGIDRLIHNQKLATKSAGITADDEGWDAKIAALSADQAALETLAAKVVVENEKTEARITELEAYIKIEGIKLSEVDIEIAEKEIQSSKADIEILNAVNAVLRIQTDTIIAATRLIDIDTEIARAKADISQTDASIAKIGLLAFDLEREQAQTTIIEGERDLASARANLAVAKSGGMDSELTFYESTLPQQSNTEKEKIREAMNQKDTVRHDKLDQEKGEKDLSRDVRGNESKLGPKFAEADAIAQVAIDTQKLATMYSSSFDRNAKTVAAIQAEELLAAANILTTLKHYVQKAPA